MAESKYTTMKKFAEMTGFSYWAIKEFVLAGKIPCVPVGVKRKMIPVDRALKSLEILEQGGVDIEQ